MTPAAAAAALVCGVSASPSVLPCGRWSWLLVRSACRRVRRGGERCHSGRRNSTWIMRSNVSGAVGSVSEGAMTIGQRTSEGTIAGVGAIVRLEMMLLHELEETTTITQKQNAR